MKHSTSSKLICLVLTVLLAAAVLTGCAGTTQPAKGAQTTAPSTQPDAATPIGEGETVFRFTVTFSDGSEKAYDVSTDGTVVGEALQAVGLIAGDESNYGLYVKTVDGETLDYDADGMYWSFYVDGEYAVSGVDTTDIVPASVYSFVAEKG